MQPIGHVRRLKGGFALLIRVGLIQVGLVVPLLLRLPVGRLGLRVVAEGQLGVVPESC